MAHATAKHALDDTVFGAVSANLMRGANHWLEDLQRAMKGDKPAGAEDFQVGRDVAVTPGK